LNCKDKPELRERLAAEYALGTLRGAARERFRRWMRDDPALARSAAQWEERLMPLAEAVAPVEPPATVWRRIEARTGGAASRNDDSGKDKGFLWRALGLVAGGAAAALLVMAMVLPLQRPGGEYVALLSDPKTQKPVLLVTAGRRESRLHVKTLDPSIRVADASLELWAVPSTGSPKSLGLVPSADRAVIGLAAAADQALGNVPVLAVSLEPRGGSPTGAPTGPVLYTGPCIKDW
jgi:anti-sigma-K factor RskA